MVIKKVSGFDLVNWKDQNKKGENAVKKRNVVGVLFGLMLILVLTLGPSMKVSAAEQVPYVNITVDNNDILSISDKSISKLWKL